jgi:hypothetical protein
MTMPINAVGEYYSATGEDLRPHAPQLSPAEATARLAEKTKEYADRAKSSATPTNTVGAQRRIEELKADKAFGARVLAGEKSARAELQGLHELVRADPNSTAALAMAGLQPDGHIEVDNNGASLRDQISAVPDMRAAGLSEEVIAQVLSDAPVSRSEYEKAKALRARLRSDQDFTSRVLAKEFEATRISKLISVILASRIEGEN